MTYRDQVPLDFKVRCRAHDHDILWHDCRRFEIDWKCHEHEIYKETE